MGIKVQQAPCLLKGMNPLFDAGSIWRSLHSSSAAAGSDGFLQRLFSLKLALCPLCSVLSEVRLERTVEFRDLQPAPFHHWLQTEESE